MQTIEQNAIYTASYDPMHKFLSFSVNGYIDVVHIRAYLARQVEWARANKVLGICADLTMMDGTITPLSGYIAHEYFAPLRSLGLCAAAIVVSEEILCRLAARDFVTRMGEQDIVMFHEKHEAMKWLHRCVHNHKK